MSGEGWHLNPRRRVVLFILAPVVGALVVVGGVSMITNGALPVGAGIGVCVFGIAIALVPLTKRNVRLPATSHTRQGAVGTLIPLRTPGAARLIVFGLLSLVFLVLAAIFLLVSVRDEKWGAGIAGVGITSLLCMVFGLGFMGTLISRRVQDRGIFVSGAGLVLADRRTPVALAWDDIEYLRPHWRRRALGKVRLPSPTDIVSNWLTFERRAGAKDGDDDVYSFISGTREPTILAEDLACDPVRVLQALNTYLTEPATRRELGTDAAVHRFSAA